MGYSVGLACHSPVTCLVHTARQVMAAPFDCVKWSESPEMVVVKKERNVSLGLSITTRQVSHMSSVGLVFVQS